MHMPLSRLRPMSLSDIFDAIFQLYRNNFFIFIGIAALVQIPIILFQIGIETALGQQYITDFTQLADDLTFFDPQSDSVSDLPIGGIVSYFGLSLVLSFLQIVVVQQLVSGALANAISRRYLDLDVSVLGAYAIGWQRFVSLILVGLIVAIIAGLLGSVLIGVYIGGVVVLISLIGSMQGTGAVITAIIGIIGLILGILLVITLFFLIALRFVFVTQAVVIENHGPMSALGRSWRLISGSFWRVLGIVALLFILVQIVVAIPVGIASFGLSIVLGGINDPLQNYALRQTLTILVSYAAQILVLPLQLGAYTLVYYDLRIRKEGYDLEVMAEQYAAPTTQAHL